MCSIFRLLLIIFITLSVNCSILELVLECLHSFAGALTVMIYQRLSAGARVANKAIYRCRMALADGGELVVIAPGVKQFGEDAECNTFIRRLDYRMALCGPERNDSAL